QPDLGVAFQERRDDRRQHGVRDVGRHVDSQRAGRAVAEMIDHVERGLHFGQRRRQSFGQALSRLGGRHAARGAMEQAHAEACFEAFHRIAQLRGRAVAAACRLAKAAGLHHGQEGEKVLHVGCHCSGLRTARAECDGLSGRECTPIVRLSPFDNPMEKDMSHLKQAGTFSLGDRSVNRMGYGAMQLAGTGVFGPPKDHAAALAVLRAALEAGVNHIDTSDFYGPHVTNRIIREALHPYADDLVIVTKVGALRGDDASWNPAQSPAELEQAVHDNLRNLGLDVLEVVNLRIMGDVHAPSEGSIEPQFSALARLQQQGLIRHLGLSNATAAQVAEAQRIAPVVCVQNQFNLAHREDDALVDALGAQGIAYVPFFPLGGFTPLQSQTLSDVAARLDATPMQVALAWLLARAPNILLIPGTSSTTHLRENLAAAQLRLDAGVIAELDGMTPSS